MATGSRLRRILKARWRRLAGGPAEPGRWDGGREEPPPRAEGTGPRQAGPRQAGPRQAGPRQAGARGATSRRREWLAILELPPGASGEEIRAAYRELCKRYHPDRFATRPQKAKTADELMREINRAYRELTAGD